MSGLPNNRDGARCLTYDIQGGGAHKVVRKARAVRRNNDAVDAIALGKFNDLMGSVTFHNMNLVVLAANLLADTVLNALCGSFAVITG